MFSVHDSEEGEGEKDEYIFAWRKGSKEEEGTWDKEGSEEVKKAVEREVEKIIETLVEEELECSAELVMNEDKEESMKKDHGSTGGPTLTINIPKGTHTRGKHVKEEGLMMVYIDDHNKVLHVQFQITVLAEELLEMSSFNEEGTYPKTRKMLSWVFESHIDEPEFELYQGEIIQVLESKETNPLVNAQQLSNEQLCNALNKVTVETKDRLFGRNDRVIFLEEKLEKKEEDLV